MKRFLAVLLALVLVLASGTFAFAAEGDNARTLKEATGVFVGSDAIYAVDHTNNLIYKAKSVTGDWTVFAGKSLPDDMFGEAAGSYLDGGLTDAIFNRPTDMSGFMKGYAISDTANNYIRYIEGTSVKTLLDKTAKLSMPTALATDKSGNLYIADTGNDRVLMLTESGTLSTIVSGLSAPRGLCVAGNTLYIADTGNHRILKYENSAVSMVAGATGESGYIDGGVAKARFSNPTGIAVDARTGKIYVGDCGNNAVRVIEGTTVDTFMKADAIALDEFPSEPIDMTFNGGNLYIADADAGVQAIEISVVAEKTSDKVFTDIVASAWYRDAVTYAYNNGLFNGTTTTTFSPQTSMTRGMFVTVIGRLYGKTYAGEIIGGDTVFSDVPAGQYYAGPAAWAADNGIVNGIGGGLFAPNNNVTRQQMAAIIYAYAKMMKMDVKADKAATDAFNAMPDSAQVASWAKDAFIWAVGKGVIKGKDGNLAPNATATRAEVAQILLNLSEI